MTDTQLREYLTTRARREGEAAKDYVRLGCHEVAYFFARHAAHFAIQLRQLYAKQGERHA